MTYAQGGIIQANDFNNFAGGSAGANVSGQINSVWSTGRGNAGYGQTPVGNVAVGGTVAATNWASLINTVNAARKHQFGGSYSNIAVPTAGTIITFISTLSSAITSAYTSRLNTAQAPTLSSFFTKNINLFVGAGAPAFGTTSWTVTFASVDHCRYFFNAGGYIQLIYNGFTNTGGTARGTSIETLAGTNFGDKQLHNNFFTARGGVLGTVITDTTTGGYYGLTTTAIPPSTTVCRINSTSYYSGDYIEMQVNTNGTAGSYAANGNIIYLGFNAYSATTGSTQPSDSINVILSMRLRVFTPTTTYLTNTWGTPTIS